jgi:hypothetical protein
MKLLILAESLAKAFSKTNYFAFFGDFLKER